MYRAIPSASKILTTKWQNQQHELHVKKLQEIKGTVDKKAPQQFVHLRNKMKKNQMQEGKLERRRHFWQDG